MTYDLVIKEFVLPWASRFANTVTGTFSSTTKILWLHGDIVFTCNNWLLKICADFGFCCFFQTWIWCTHILCQLFHHCYHEHHCVVSSLLFLSLCFSNPVLIFYIYIYMEAFCASVWVFSFLFSFVFSFYCSEFLLIIYLCKSDVEQGKEMKLIIWRFSSLYCFTGTIGCSHFLFWFACMPFFAACFSYQPPSPPPSQLVLWHPT